MSARFTGRITIKDTDAGDLPGIQRLWNNGTVMRYVGFPQGLGITMAQLRQWLAGVNQDACRWHYSIYAEDIGYCGETYYKIDRAHDLAILDIKLLPEAQGKGIAAAALSATIETVFAGHLASRACVDPHPDNRKAWALYEKLGFVGQPRPVFLPPSPTYLEVTPETFRSARPEPSSGPVSRASSPGRPG